MSPPALHARRAVLAAALLLFGCGEAAPTWPDQASFASLDLGDATSTAPSAWEPATAKVTVHYPRGDKPIALLLAGLASLISCTPSSATACTADLTEFPSGNKTVAFVPSLDGTPARGPRYLVARGESLDVYPHFTTTQGGLRTLFPAFHSTVLEAAEPSNQRVIYAYLPASYDENTTKRYPVVYMHDGRNLFSAMTSISGIEWQVDETAEAAWEGTGAFEEFIAIGIDQFVTVSGSLQNRRRGEYNPTPTDLGLPKCADEYAQMVATELKPAVDGMLRTLPEREHTFSLGSSLGAGISTWITLKYPSVFGGYAALSMASAFDYAWLAGQVTAQSTPSGKLGKVYFDLGTSEGLDTITPFAIAYRGLGYTDGLDLLTLYELGGLHTESAWARRLPAALAYLLPARRLP